MTPFKALGFAERWFRRLRELSARQARANAGKAEFPAHADADRLVRFLAPIRFNMFLRSPGFADRRSKAAPRTLLVCHPSHLEGVSDQTAKFEDLHDTQYPGGSAIAAQGLPDSSRSKPVK